MLTKQVTPTKFWILVASCIGLLVACLLQFSRFMVQQLYRKKLYSQTNSTTKDLVPRTHAPPDVQPALADCTKGLIVPFHRKPFLRKTDDLTNETDAGCTADDDLMCACYSFILRDDIIVTTVECAEMASTDTIRSGNRTWLSAAEVEVEIANITTVSNKHGACKEGACNFSSVKNTLTLGVVNLKLPQHHPNIGSPRTKMLLNMDSSNANFSSSLVYHFSDSNAAFKVSCLGKVPILSVFYFQEGTEHSTCIDAEGIGNRIKPILLNVTDKLDDSFAEMRNDTSGDRWWVRKEEKEVREMEISIMFNKYRRGPEGSLDVVHIVGAGGLLQAEDPRGYRNDSCLQTYFDYWLGEVPFSGEPFFDWLDFGSGINVNDTACPREALGSFHKHFFNFTELEDSVVVLEAGDDGNLLTAAYNQTRVPVRKGRYSFVWGLDKRLYVAHVKHVVFFHAKPVLMAGEMKFGGIHGQLLSVRPSSGHYMPGVKQMQGFYRFIRCIGARHEAIEWRRESHFEFYDWAEVFSGFDQSKCT